MNEEKYRTVHVPEDPTPPHFCRPQNYVGGTKPKHKNGTIIECNDCGSFWYVMVYSTGKGTHFDPKEYHVHWSKIRWYHFKLRKYTR